MNRLTRVTVSVRQFTISSVRYNNVNDSAREKLNKILADIPQTATANQTPLLIPPKTAEEVDRTGKEEPQIQAEGESLSKSKSEKPTFGSSSYIDIFNIKQIIDTVKKSDNVKALQRELTTFYENRKKNQHEFQESFSKKMDHNVKELKSSISIASKVVNEITGYNKVIKLKDVIVDHEKKLKQLKDLIHKAKLEHEKALELRSSSQKEVNELLERKNSWTPVDLDRFTKIYMIRHELDETVAATSRELKKLEDQQEYTHDELIKSIMNRYHEEQVWSDKIRQFSTWGTILIMTINLLLVFLVQFVFEPLKRWRLVNSFEGKVKDLFSDNEKLASDINDLKVQLQQLTEEGALLTVNSNRNSTSHSEAVLDELESPNSEESKVEEKIDFQPILPPFEFRRHVIAIYVKYYYTRLRSLLMRLGSYLSPVSWTNTTPLHTTVGEFQSQMVGSIVTSILAGLFLGWCI